jgi:hypothetical protein
MTALTPKWHLDRIERDLDRIYNTACFTSTTQRDIRLIQADLADLRRLLDAER